MSKLTDLLKAGDVKYIQRDSWKNTRDFTFLLKFDVDSDTVKLYEWPSTHCVRPIVTVVNLSLEEALADDWEIVELDV
ncbi:transcriptional regulator [Salmonella phage atrejo]|uniref:Uncharacterized protein n=1 Tax=Salmonella phage atrejo TaxID=2713277 RepID=A0A6G8RJZ6_9CAUD|nr:transcriptional regulator [Salmonella phage atrejo]QIO01712.1 hypothetical protein atrejo_64 [Salmonella phage atrejo]